MLQEVENASFVPVAMPCTCATNFNFQEAFSFASREEPLMYGTMMGPSLSP